MSSRRPPPFPKSAASGARFDRAFTAAGEGMAGLLWSHQPALRVLLALLIYSVRNDDDDYDYDNKTKNWLVRGSRTEGFRDNCPDACENVVARMVAYLSDGMAFSLSNIRLPSVII